MIKRVMEWAWFPLFCIKGKKPNSFGYNYYKRREIIKGIRQIGAADALLPHGYGYRIDERIVEYRWLFQHLRHGSGTVLDAGSGLNHGYLLKREPLASKHLFVSTLCPEYECYWYRKISYVFEDLRTTCFKDGFFDDIISISTIEHIGLDNTMLYTTDMSKKETAHCDYLAAVKEWHRLLKPGGTLYVTFPFGRHVNHGWFQVFNAAMVSDLVAAFGPQRWDETYFKYTPEGWQTTTPDSLTEATFFDIHKAKGYDSDFAAASRGVACLELIKNTADQK